MSECPKTNPKIKQMMQDGTILCYVTHTRMWRCSTVACCSDCEKKTVCPNVCVDAKAEKKREYIQ